MFIPKYNMRCDVVGLCEWKNDGIELVSPDLLNILESKIYACISRIEVIYDHPPALAIHIDDPFLDSGFDEDIIIEWVEVTKREVAHLSLLEAEATYYS